MSYESSILTILEEVSETNTFLWMMLVLYGVLSLEVMFWRQEARQEKKDIDRLKEPAEEIIKRANDQASQIIGEARNKAIEVLRSTELISHDSKEKLEKSIQTFLQQEVEHLGQTSDKLVQAYQDAGQEAKQDYLKTLETVSLAVTKDGHEVLARFREEAAEKLKRYRQAMEEQFEEGKAGAQKDIEKYKQEALGKVENSIYDLLLVISKKVLGKALHLEEQQEIVARALEEAKKEGFFR